MTLQKILMKTEFNHLQMSWVVFRLIIWLLFLLKAIDVLFHIVVYRVSRSVIKSEWAKSNHCGKTGHAPPIVLTISWLESQLKRDLFAHFLAGIHLTLLFSGLLWLLFKLFLFHITLLAWFLNMSQHEGHDQLEKSQFSENWMDTLIRLA